jgi:uncharacterized protein YutE (UPF0331/DUF86 family)
MPIKPDDVIYNKAAIIERSLKRMKEEYSADPDLENYTHIDAMILNIERACQAAVDMAMHIVSVTHSGIPQNSAEAFILLSKNKLCSSSTAKSMVAMTGFRNVAIHEYQKIELAILKAIAEKEWKGLVVFCKEMGVSIDV